METIDRDDLKTMMRDQPRFCLLEVLSAEDYDAGHLPGAMNVPLEGDFEAAVAHAAPRKDEPVVVYCQHESCDASPRAARRLDEMGYQHVYDYAGGKQDWERAGLSLKRS